MRVLFIVHGFPPRATGGTEMYSHGLARTIAGRHGTDVRVLTREVDPSRPEYTTRRERVDGIDTLWVNNSFRQVTSFEDSYRNPAIRQVGAAFIDEVQPDLAHVHHLTCLSTELVVELRRRGVPIVFTLHDFWLICHRGQLLDLDYRICRGPYPAGCDRCVGLAGTAGPGGFRATRLLRAVDRWLPEPAGRVLRRPLRSAAALAAGATDERRASDARRRHMQGICSLVDRFLSPSKTVYTRFVEFGVSERRMSRHEYGIDVARFGSRPRTTADHLRVAFLGSLMISKGGHILLEAFRGLPPGRASLHVFGDVVGYHGDDSYRRRIEPRLAGPGIHRMGGIPHERVPEVLASVDVLVVPSIWLENSPLVIREASAAGVPVVASNLGGMAELVRHEDNGLLFTAGSVTDLRRQLRRLIDEPALLARLRAGVREVRTVEDDADETYRLYQTLVAAASGRETSRRRASRR